ncbi:MAG: hypothetical protein H7A32_02210 [Deltaproteobacteria bacterium]|nr:hypothetical protein [Deltaproteobacteria bacterium]
MSIGEWVSSIFDYDTELPNVLAARKMEAYQIPSSPCETNTVNLKRCQSHFTAAQSAADNGNSLNLETHLRALAFDDSLCDKLRYEAAKKELQKNPRGWVKTIRKAHKDLLFWEKDLKTLHLLAGYLQNHSQKNQGLQEQFHEIAYWTYDRYIEAVMIKIDDLLETASEDVEKQVGQWIQSLQNQLEEGVSAKVLLERDRQALIQRWDFIQMKNEANAAARRSICVTHLLKTWSILMELRGNSLDGIAAKNMMHEANDQLKQAGWELGNSGKDLKQHIQDGKVTRVLYYRLEEMRNQVREGINKNQYDSALILLNRLIYEIYRIYPKTSVFQSNLGHEWLEAPIE